MSNLISFFIELIKLYLLQRLMGYTTTKKLVLPCCVVIASFVFVWFLQEVFGKELIIITYNFLAIIIISLSFKGRNKLISTFLGMLTLWFVDYFIISIFTTLFSEPIELFSDSVSIIILAAIFGIFRLLKKPYLLKFETFNKKQVVLYAIGLFSSALYLSYYQMSLGNNTTRVDKYLAIISSISGIFLIVISINAGQKRHYKEYADITEKMRKSQEQYFQLLLNKEEETKKFRHDFNNHLYSIKYLLENGKEDDLKKYINDMDIVSENLKSEIQTGNDIINAIICQLRESYKDVNYIIDWNGYFRSDLQLAPIDLSSIFYNLLANAIEAIENMGGQDGKTISVTVKHSNDLLYFSVKNPCASRAVRAGSGFATSKMTKALHGIGSKNVAISVEKYGGEIKYNTGENEFEAEVFFFDL